MAELRDVLHHPLVFVTGKGGTGKTTVAGALATAAAHEGRRTVLCEPAGGRPLGAGLPPGVGHVAIDQQTALREWLRRHPGGSAAAALLAGSAAFQQLVAAAPGAAELVSIGKLGDLVASGRFDTVVVDAPSTGHMVALVAAPRTYAGIAHAGRIGRDAGMLRELLVDRERTAYVGVTLPEEMPARELLELDAALGAELGRGLDAAVVDQLWPARLSAAEARRLRAIARRLGDPRALAFLDAALAQHRRALAHARCVDELRSATDVPVAVLPQPAADPLGPDELAYLGELLVASAHEPHRLAA